uniref:Uncharacterized protein n=1 Tax=mine drainage metagenome TaxID=410659 RepID=E6PYF2_9ZZZZ
MTDRKARAKDRKTRAKGRSNDKDKCRLFFAEEAAENGLAAADANIPFRQVAATLEGDHAVVEVHGEGGAGEVCWRELVAGPVGVEFVDEGLGQLDEGAFAAESATVLVPVGGVEVFNEIDAVGRGAGIEIAEGINDVSHLVAAIVENDVWRAKLVEDGLQKSCVGLAADANGDLVFGELCALGVDVDADDLSVGAEVTLPHLCGAATAAADLEKEQRAVDVAAEVGLVGGEIVGPLVDGALLVIEKFRPETHGRPRNRRSTGRKADDAPKISLP